MATRTVSQPYDGKHHIAMKNKDFTAFLPTWENAPNVISREKSTNQNGIQ